MNTEQNTNHAARKAQIHGQVEEEVHQDDTNTG